MLATTETAPTVNAADHVALAFAIAKSFRRSGIDTDDIEGEALLGLTRAAREYEDGRGVKFGTFAFTVIRRQVLNFLRRHRALAPLPTDLATGQQFEPEDYRDEASETPEARDLAGWVRGLLRFLHPHQRRVVELRFGLDGHPPRTLREVGEVLGVKHQAVRQIEQAALKRLRAVASQVTPEPTATVGICASVGTETAEAAVAV
jgi:RNA polymerase sigma factor (sigma-70 family)